MTTRSARVTLLALLSAASLPAVAQTSTHKSTTTHRSSSPSASAKSPSKSASTSAATANPADNPPGVPPATGTPKPLYALRYVDILVGDGPLAQPQKFYSVKYTGWLTDGTKFDSSDDHPGKEPITFAYGAHRVITGWDTGFEGMRVGGKRRLYIPYQLAYGEPGRPGAIPPKADLIFDIELVAQSDSPNPPAAAPQPATPPPASTTDPTKPASTPPPASSDPEAPKPQQPQSR